MQLKDNFNLLTKMLTISVFYKIRTTYTKNNESAYLAHLWVFAITCTFQLRQLFRVNQTALRAVLKPENMWSRAQAIQISVRFKYASFYHRFQSFQSLFLSLSLLAVWIYFNRLKITGALLELINFFRIFICCLFWHPRVARKGSLILYATGSVSFAL